MRLEPGFEASRILDSRNRGHWEDVLKQILLEFLATNIRSGFALVKTSNTGNRSQSHEVSTSLLSWVLEVVTDRLGPGRVILADGPAYAESYHAECQRLGWDGIATKTGAVIIDLNHDQTREPIPDWPVSKAFLSADAVINLCKAKTHRRFGVTLGAKNLLGVLAASALGYPKLKGRHAVAPWLVSKLAEISPQAITIIDGHEGIEGEGPLNGTPTKSHFLSTGPGYYGPDTLAAIEMGFDPILVPGFIRPGRSNLNAESVRWSDYRQGQTDFLPAVSCSWLYRSLNSPANREKRYQLLLDGAKECWPQNS